MTKPVLQHHYQDPRPYPKGVAYMDGQYIPMNEAKISVLDWGFLRSDATYDVVHAWEGAFFRLDKYVDRFLNSVEKLRMTLPVERTELEDILHNCVGLSGLQNAYVEMICTRGSSPTFSRDPRDSDNRLICFAIPLGSIANKDQQKRGLHIAISDVVRIAPQSVDPTIKNYHWLDLIAGLFEAYDRGAENTLLVDHDGNVTEGPGFNIFAVKDGVVYTPSSGVLEGITRQTVIDLCKELNLPCQIQALPKADFLKADEIFLSSTAGGPQFISKIDDTILQNGAAGPVFSKIKDLYWQKHQDASWITPIEYD
ncbi:aminotransferase class IV [Curvivirga aplysinae]|uniref:aminotransferase class IV n=1 Tax=Curvivirga aplysinae TaxID=2529852 RepID=UPI0012BD0602|nr:aminotransferase class IV [Curvivirga aplysinae]MTI09897.1 branched-chain amino acid transferase [Curvivirga aplysinae]